MQTFPLSPLRQPGALRAITSDWKRQGLRVGLVPTMGALHAGHVSLAKAARAATDRVVVSLFVNPSQFAPHEDFDAYPRTEQADIALLAAENAADLVYAPHAREMYPPGFATTVSPSGPAIGLESDSRPHFFAGVATVVTKLLLQSGADMAFFGEKDFQQLAVIRRIVCDLNIACDIAGCPTLREADGLALSSRNVYLSAEARAVAGRLNRILFELALRVADGADPLTASAGAKAALLEAGFDAVDYVEVRDAETLSTHVRPDRPRRVLAAARTGGVRLIDNCAV
jgi:pantoate--beta-alanine ligase